MGLHNKRNRMGDLEGDVMRRQTLMQTILLIGALLGTSIAYADAPVPSDPQVPETAHRTLHGTVTKIENGMLFLRTEEGTIRNFSTKNIKEVEKVRNLKEGDALVLEFDEGNQIIHIDRLSEHDALSEAERHQTVAGHVEAYDPLARTLTLKLRDGTTRSFELKPSASLKAAGLKKGTVVVMEIDEDNDQVMDLHEQE